MDGKPEQVGQFADGTQVDRVTLRGGGLTAEILSYGAVVQDLRLDGHAAPLVLGLPRITDYPDHSPYFGAIVGRVANRIGGAEFELDGRAYRLDRNSRGGHHLHGGSDGTGVQAWTIEDSDRSSVTLSLLLPDGHMGYPGALRVRARYALLAEATLDLQIEATADAPTLCNFAHHSYFNLSGARDIRDHRLTVLADRYLPVDGDLIPTGQVAEVAGTPFDFRTGARLGDRLDQTGIDHNFCLSGRREPIRDVAELSAGGLTMTLRTTEPGLQVYDGCGLDLPVTGLDGRSYGAHAGLALEPQLWPDAIHHPGWSQPVLHPGEHYRQHTQFVFRKG